MQFRIYLVLCSTLEYTPVSTEKAHESSRNDEDKHHGG